MPICLQIIYDSFQATMVKWIVATETVVLQSLIYLFLGLHRKSLLTPGQFKSYSGFMRHKYIHSWNKYMFIFIIMFKEVQGARCIKEQNKSSALMKIIA